MTDKDDKNDTESYDDNNNIIIITMIIIPKTQAVSERGVRTFFIK